MNNQNITRYRKAIGEIDALYHELALKHCLSDSADAILYAICSNGDRCSLKDIVLFSGVSKQTVNSSLRKLEREGLIYLQLVNGKSKEAVLTEKGKDKCRDTVAKLVAIENKLLSKVWSEEEFIAYIELTEKYTRDLKRLIAEDL